MSLVAELGPGSRPQEIRMYIHGTVEIDMSVNLIYDSELADLFITPVLFVHLRPFSKARQVELVEAKANSDD